MSEQPNVDAPTENTTDGSAQEAKNVDQLPEWARNELTEARAEAAKYRTQRNEAAEKAKAEAAAEFEAKLAELSSAKEAVEKQLADAQLAATKTRAAFGALLPEDDREAFLGKATEFAGLLQGSTEDEISAHAEKLSSLFGGFATTNNRGPAVDKTPAGKPVALNDDDGLFKAIQGALGI